MLRDRGGVLEAHRVGDLRERALVRRDRLGVTAAADQAEHAVADAEPLDAVADRVDLAGDLETGNVGRRVGRRWICAHALQQIRAVDRGRADAYAHFAARRLGRRPLDEA